MTLKKLPIGIQTFSKVRKADCVYVDKTEIIYAFIKTEGAYFLSRPRRFGKSLLLDTIKELFEGNQALFEGLYIYDKWDWTKTNPVIRIDFAGGTIQSRAELEEKIQDILNDYQEKFAIQCQRRSIAGCFAELIQKTHEHYGQKVVILIDEYDKPILDNILKIDIASEVREGLKNIYSVMKEQDGVSTLFRTRSLIFS